jgi:DNA-binding response OmpR family regulator
VTTVLVIEDERDLAAGIQANLEIEGYDALVAHTGEDGLELARSRHPDLVMLDLMLPRMSGFDVLARLRAAGHDVPVLILSARAEEVDKVRGFRTGADDYVTKPFGVMELMLRVRALLRRAAPRGTGGEGGAAPAVQRIGRVEVDFERRAVVKDGRELPLAPRAFELLAALLRRRDRVVTRHELLRDVWGYSADVTTRTVDAHIAELRRRIEDDPARPAHILTVWKAGYRLKG